MSLDNLREKGTVRDRRNEARRDAGANSLLAPVTLGGMLA